MLAPVAAVAGGGTAYAGATADAAFVTAINAERVSHGEKAYRVSADLTSIATAWAHRMAAANRLYHNPDLTTDVHHWLVVGENVGYGPDVRSLVQAFWNSPEHKANILDRDYTQVGVGTDFENGVLWVSEVFRKPDSSAGSTTIQAPRHLNHRLSVGCRGLRVAWVQQRLHISPDGIFGMHTKRAVNRYKGHHGMRRNGFVGRRAWARMHRTS
jgi:hypothetical protein